MPDNLSRTQRAYTMSRIRSKDTKPEIAVRSLLHKLGYRFKLHCKDLPGTPDIVLPKLHKIIFVNGCFWHKHSCKNGRVLPRNNQSYWTAKLDKNRLRMKKNIIKLKKEGWSVFIIWECWTKDNSLLHFKITDLLSR